MLYGDRPHALRNTLGPRSGAGAGAGTTTDRFDQSQEDSDMTSGSFVPLAGSERTAISGVQDLGPVNEQERIEVTVVLRRRAELPDELVFSPETISQSELADTYGAEPADVELVRETLSGLGLEITATDQASRRIKVAGTASALTQAFGTSLRQARSTKPGVSGEVEHRYREGAPAGARRARRHRDRGPRPGQPAAGPGADHGRPRRAAQDDLLHPAPGRPGLPVPGGHRRHRADDRDPGVRRRVTPPATCRPTSPDSACPSPRSRRSAWTAGPTRPGGPHRRRR